MSIPTHPTGSGAAGYTRAAACLFDDRHAAERAVLRLVQAGIPHTDILMTDGAAAGATPGTGHDPAFRQPVEALPVPEEDRACYAEGLARGGLLVAVLNLNDAQHDLALVILDEEGAVDLTAREAQWRAEGWTGAMEEGVLPDDVRGTTRDTAYTDPREGDAGHEGTSLRAGTNLSADAGSAGRDRSHDRGQTGVRDTSRGPTHARSYLIAGRTDR